MLATTYHSWQSICLDTDSDPSLESLISGSRDVFQDLQSSPDEALAQLIHVLGPALKSDLSTSIVRALNFIQGSLIGLSSSSSNDGSSNKQELHAETLELLESYLLAQCSCSSTVDGAVSEVIVAAIGCVESLVKCYRNRVSEISDCCDVLQLSQSAVESAGISSLMRAGRSACFSLLMTAIQVSSHIVQDTKKGKVEQDQKDIIKNYSSFCSSCLDGEKDPRCLLAALKLLRLCATVFPEYVQFDEIFHSASIYYPISFTPPPNDPYKITKEDLKTNLLGIICNSHIPTSSILSLFKSHLDDGDELEEDFRNDDTCLNRCDVLEDLMNWITGRSQINSFNEDLGELSSELEELSHALVNLHCWVFKTAPSELMSMIDKGNDNLSPPARLSYTILQTASSIASIVEKNNIAWSKFCGRSVSDLSSSVGDMPESMRGRSATSFLLAIARSGATAHRLCVKEVTPQILNIVRSAVSFRKSQNHSMIDIERLVAALYALGSLMRIKNKSTIVFHPDPILNCANEALPLLVSIAFDFAAESNSDKLIGASAAALYALSSIMSKCMSDSAEIERIMNVVIDNVCLGNKQTMYASGVKLDIFYKACVEFLGFVFLPFPSKYGVGSPQMLSVLINSSLLRKLTTGYKTRFDVLALVSISIDNHELSEYIVSEIVEVLSTMIYSSETNGNDPDDLIFVAKTLSIVVLKGGTHARIAWQGKCLKIFQSLLQSVNKIDDDKVAIMGVVKQLTECFQSSSFDTRCSMVKLVSPIIPPLNEVDFGKLVLSLPLLAAVLHDPSDLSKENETNEELSKMLPSLCDFALNNDVNQSTRSSASIIIHSTILKCGKRQENLALSALQVSIFPVLIESSMNNKRDIFCDALRLATTMASAAACKGGNSSTSSDALVRFLTSLVCTGSGSLPGIECMICPKFGRKKRASLLAAEFFGLFFAISTCDNPFWKQRSISICLRRLIETCQNSSSIVPPLSPLIALSHISCCVSTSIIGQSNLQTISDLIIRGLLNYSVSNDEADIAEEQFLAVGLAVILKFLNLRPSLVMDQHVDNIVPILLHVVTSRSKSNGESRKIIVLALQCLFLLKNHLPASKNIFEGTRIVSALGVRDLLDHKNRVVRNAVMRVRNVWFISRDFNNFEQGAPRDV